MNAQPNLTVVPSDAPNIQIPVVEITDGWTVDDIKTEDDCDDAFAYLTGAIIAIESRIKEGYDNGWASRSDEIRTKAALKWKKSGLQIVATKRARIRQESRQLHHEKTRDAQNEQLLAIVRRDEPEVFRRALITFSQSQEPTQ